MTNRQSELLLAALWLAGCTSFGSVAPLVTDDNAIVDPRLIGTWQDSGSTMAVAVTESRNGYQVSMNFADGERMEYSARLGQVGTLRVFELLGREAAFEPGEAGNGPLLRLYYPVLIDSLGPELRTRMFNPDSLEYYLRKHSRSLDHNMRSQSIFSTDIIITAPTRDWQRFLEGYARQSGVTEELHRLSRMPTPRLEFAARMHGRPFHFEGAGACIRARSGRFYGRPADTWRVSFESTSPDSTVPEKMELKSWTSATGATQFKVDAKSDYRGGADSPWFELAGAGALQITERDSAATLRLEGVDFVGDSVHIAVTCSPVTLLVPDTTDG